MACGGRGARRRCRSPTEGQSLHNCADRQPMCKTILAACATISAVRWMARYGVLYRFPTQEDHSIAPAGGSASRALVTVKERKSSCSVHTHRCPGRRRYTFTFHSHVPVMHHFAT